MIYTNRNSVIKINNQNLFVNRIEIDSTANISPVYVDGQRHTTSFSNEGNVMSSIRISYFITGSDIIKNFCYDNALPISGYLAGIFFQSGYLNSYSVSIQPNAPIEATADISIFGAVTGIYDPNKILRPDIKPLNGSDIIVESLTESTTPYGNIYSVTYNYNTEIAPIYFEKTGLNLSDINPDRIAFGKKTASMEIITDSPSGHIPINALNSAVRVKALYADSNVAEIFNISGKMIKRSFDLSSNNYQKIQIIQNRIADQPSVTSFYPLVASAGDTINIDGQNFTNTIRVSLNNEDVSNYNINSDTNISFVLDAYLNSGLLRVENLEDVAYSQSNFGITYPSIQINSIDPVNLTSGNSVVIQGVNFYKISDVIFGGTSSTSFTVINDNIINAIVPGRIANSGITIGSSSRTKTGVSTFNYYAYPVIDVFYPKTGINGNNIMISGANLYDISAITINDIEASYSLIDTGSVQVTVPTGNTLGYIKITNQAGLSTLSKNWFRPVVSITGSGPLSGVFDTSILLSGANFYSYSMYEYLNNGTPQYKVSFNGTPTGLFIVNDLLMSGKVPYNAKSGPIYIYKPDGVSTYDTTGNFTYINNPPIIKFSAPSGIVSGDSLNLLLVGENLTNITKVYAKGSGINLGRSIIIWENTYNQLAPTTNTTGIRYLNTSGQYDILGLAAMYKHTPYFPISLSGNSMITGASIRSGIYDLYVETTAGTGCSSGAFTINPLINLAQLSSTKIYASSITSGEENYYGPYKLVDNDTGTLSRTKTLPSQFFKFEFASKCQVFQIDINSTYVDFSAANNYLEISLITGVSTGSYTGIISSGIVSMGQYSYYSSGYGINTGTASWRNEANAVLIRSHKFPSGPEQNYALALSEIKIHGIKMDIS